MCVLLARHFRHLPAINNHIQRHMCLQYPYTTCLYWAHCTEQCTISSDFRQNSRIHIPDFRAANPSILSNKKHQTEPGPASSKSTMRPPSPQTSREMPLSRSWHLQGIRLSWIDDHPVLKHVQLHPRFDYDTCIYVYMCKNGCIIHMHIYIYIYKVNVCIMLSPIHNPCTIPLQFPTSK